MISETIFAKLWIHLKAKGAGDTLKSAAYIMVRKRVGNYALIRKMFADKSGLEIGGPSGDFKDHGYVPLYKIIKNLDGCNFSDHTIWEGNIKRQYVYAKRKAGVQFIAEATDLIFAASMSYDFIISSNCLEHIANPLKAIEEWDRVIKRDGSLLLIVPRKDNCFDHKRPVTEFAHLLEDYRNDVKEDDLTHMPEILALHDLNMDGALRSVDQLRGRSANNFNNRAFHHHVFNSALLVEIYAYFKLPVLLAYDDKSSHLILGKRP